MPRKRGESLPPKEREANISSVADMLLMGMPTRQIYSNAEQRGWNVSRRSIDQYIAQAQKNIQRDSQKSRPLRISIADRRLDLVWQKAFTANDYKTCLAAVKESNELFGLYEKPDAAEAADYAQIVEAAYRKRAEAAL